MLNLSAVETLFHNALHDLKVGANKAEAAARSVLTAASADAPEAQAIAKVVAAVVPGAASVPSLESLGEALVSKALAALNGADAAASVSGLNIALDQTEIANIKAVAVQVKALINPTAATAATAAS